MNNGNATRKSLKDFFKSAGPAAVSRLAEIQAHCRFRAGECLINEHEAASGIYLIRSGEVELVMTARGRRIRVGTAAPGAFLGLSSIFGDLHETIGAYAATGTSVTFVPKAQFRGFLHQFPDCYLIIAEILSHETVRADDAIRHARLDSLPSY